jgi:hypothetical protein
MSRTARFKSAGLSCVPFLDWCVLILDDKRRAVPAGAVCAAFYIHL